MTTVFLDNLESVILNENYYLIVVNCNHTQLFCENSDVKQQCNYKFEPSKFKPCEWSKIQSNAC